MIFTKTVLVLGAGASMPYGFPSGEGLVKIVCDHLRLEGSDFAEDLAKCGVEQEEINEFREALEFSYQPSIDAFLEHRPEFLKVGKLAIARALIPCEYIENMGRNVDGNWYAGLFRLLNAPPDLFRSNRLSIVTFNYVGGHFKTGQGWAL